MKRQSLEEAAATLAQGAEAYESLLGRLDEETGSARGTIGGGAWSAKDLAGHIETWEEVALQTIEDVSASRPPSIRGVVTGEASLDLFNAGEVERKAGRSWPEALSSLHQTNARLVQTILSLTQAEWEGPVPTPDSDEHAEVRSLGQEVGSNTGMPESPFRHAWAHIDDLTSLVALLEQQPGA